MSFVVVTTSLLTAVADGGTLEVQYPAGLTTETIFGTGHEVVVNDNDVYTLAEGDISLAFGATSVVITNASGATWPAKARYKVQLETVDALPAQPDQDVDAVYTVGGGTAKRSTRARLGDVSKAQDWGGLAGGGIADEGARLALFLSQTSKDIVLERGKTYRVASSYLTLGAGSRLRGEGATIILDVEDGSSNSRISVGAGGYIEGLRVLAPTGAYFERGISFGLGAGFRDLTIEAEDQIEYDDVRDGAIKFSGGSNTGRGLKVINFDLGMSVTAADILLEDAYFTSFKCGINMKDAAEHLTFKNVIGVSKSPNAATNPGNGLIVGTPVGDLNLLYCRTLAGSGEHAFYSAADAAGASGLRVIGCGAMQPGQCGFKFRYWNNVYFADNYSYDSSTGNTPGTNEDGARFEYCTDVDIRGFQVRKYLISSSSYDGLHIANSNNVTFEGVVIDSPVRSGVWIEGDSHTIHGKAQVNNPGTGGYVTLSAISSTTGDFRIDIDGKGGSGVPVQVSATGDFTSPAIFTGRVDKTGSLATVTTVTNYSMLVERVQATRPSLPSILLPETMLWYDACAVAPPFFQARAIDDLIHTLKADGLWTKIDGIWVFAVHTIDAALINIKSPGTNNLTKTASITHTPFLGFTGNGSSEYLAGPNLTALTNYTKDSASAFVYTLSDSQDDPDFGVVSTAGGNQSFHINPRNASDQFVVELNTGSSLTDSQTNSIGFWAGNRSSASSVKSYKNGVNEATGTFTSEGPANTAVAFLRNAAAYSARTIGMGGLGGSLTATEHASLYRDVQRCMKALGAV